MGLIELIPHDSLVNHHHRNMIRSRHPPFSGSPKKNISIWCREIAPWISQCWFNQPFSGPGGYQVGFIDPMTNISKQCNMSVGKTQKKRNNSTHICVALPGYKPSISGQGSVPDSQIMAKPKAVKELKANLGRDLFTSEATWGPETFLWPNFGFWPTNMVT